MQLIEFLLHAPVPVLAAAIFGLRILDVSLGTLRTISVVHGRIPVSVVLGFFEVLVWITAVSQVIRRVDESPVLLVAYAGGFATGNAIGITLERRLRLGRAVVRFVTSLEGSLVADALRRLGLTVAEFSGRGEGGPTVLVLTTMPRRRLPDAIRAARSVDPDVYFTVDRFSEVGDPVLPHVTGWRAVFKKK